MRQPPETRFFIRTCRKPPSTVPLSLIDLRTTVLSLPLDFIIHLKCYFLFVFYGDRKSSRLSQQKKHHRGRSSGLSNPLQKSLPHRAKSSISTSPSSSFIAASASSTSWSDCSTISLRIETASSRREAGSTFALTFFLLSTSSPSLFFSPRSPSGTMPHLNVHKLTSPPSSEL